MSGKRETQLIGVDTHVLLRTLVQDDAEQAALAEQWLRTLSAHDRGYVSLVVMCELTWVLSSRYGYSRVDIADALSKILGIAALEVEAPEAAAVALRYFRSSDADFADCCIAALAQRAGCLQTVTFDVRASRLPGMRLLR